MHAGQVYFQRKLSRAYATTPPKKEEKKMHIPTDWYKQNETELDII